MSERKFDRKFDGKPYHLAKTGSMEAWFYNNPKSITLVVSERGGKTLQITVRKTTLRNAAALP